jgi:uncharacterized protein YqgV (UPF0045/DUF77 family)
VVRVEFTIEPFIEGSPGEHVTSAIDAARDRGGDVEVGPFGTVCDVADDDAGPLVMAVVDAAVAHGATHVSLHVEVTP